MRRFSSIVRQAKLEQYRIHLRNLELRARNKASYAFWLARRYLLVYRPDLLHQLEAGRACEIDWRTPEARAAYNSMMGRRAILAVKR